MKHLLVTLTLLCSIVFSISCSEDELGDFQQNDPEPEFTLFTLLDDYPALRSAFNSVDPYRFNELLSESMNNIPGDAKSVLNVIDDLIAKKTDTLASTRNILYRVLNQYKFDRDFNSSFKDPEYSVNAFPYYDMISEYVDPATNEKLNLTKPILAVARKMFGYLKYKFKNEDELDEVVTAFINHLRDDDANIMKVLFDEIIAKLLLQANESVWYDEDGKLLLSNDTGKEGARDTGLGNAVRGIDAFLSGHEEEMKDSSVKNGYYEFFKELGNFASVTVKVNGEVKNLATVLKDLICNIEKHFTEGGEVFESNDGNNDYNRGYIDEYDNVISELNERTGKTEYVSAELTNTVQELFPFFISLFKRSDKDLSIAYNDKSKQPYYFISRWLNILKDMGFDPENAQIEEKLYDTIRFDVWGRDRLKNIDDPDIAKRPFVANFLQQLAFLICMGENFGWLDSFKEGAQPEVNHGHGPLETAGYTPSGDTFTNGGLMSLPEPTKGIFAELGIPGLIDLYELAWKGDYNPWEQNHIFRSSWEFDSLRTEDTFTVENGSDISEHRFYSFNYDTDFNILGFLPTQLSGDSGTPWGGNEEGDEGIRLNSYRAYCPDGRGEPDFINVFLTTFVRSVWDGEGPYYSKENMKVDTSEEYPVHTYYRPDKREYVRITKPDANDPETWIYFYPFCGEYDVLWDETYPHYKDEYEGQRMNCRYYEKVYYDYFMMHLDDVLLYRNEWIGWADMYITPDDAPEDSDDPGIYGIGKGLGVRKIIVPYSKEARTEMDNENLENFNAGSVCIRELIPEMSIERECDTNLEALYRNLQFYCAEKKFTFLIPINLSISMAEIIDGLLQDFVPASLRFMWDPFIDMVYNTIVAQPLLQAAVFYISETNGAYGLANFRNVKVPFNEMSDADYTTNSRWALKRNYDVDREKHPNGVITGGQSFIPGDCRVNLIYECDDLFTLVCYLGNALITGLYEIDPMYTFNAFLGFFTGEISIEEGVPAFFLNNFIEGGNSMGGPVSTSMSAFVRMPFLRAVDPREPEKPIDIIGSRKGDLLKERNWKWEILTDQDNPDGIVHPEWGFDVSDSDPNWNNRNSFLVEGFIGFIVALRDCSAPFYETKEEWIEKREGDIYPQTSNNDYNPSKGFLDTVIGSLASPLMYYQHGDDGSYPRKSWAPRMIDDHSVFFRTFEVPGSSGTGSWEERAYYRPAENVNLLSVISESDPFGDYNGTPMRCDGLLPLLTEYDVTRPPGPDNPPNTRLITKLFKLALEFTDSKFDERPPDYDEDDYSTWSAREKIRYGFEQMLSSIKTRKGDRFKINEMLDSRIHYWPTTFLFPDWIFSDYGIRPEDIDLDKVLKELIGSDDTGKGLAVIPDNRPNPEDWKNFNLFVDALGELFSDKGETAGRYNIMSDLIEFVDLLNLPEAEDSHLKGLRHTLGVVFTIYNRDTKEWEYPKELLYIVTEILPDILETFKGRYYSLCNLIESLMKEEGFLEYFIYALDSDYSGKELFEQIYEFLGDDIIASHDSAFWIDLAELLDGFAEMIIVNDVGDKRWINDELLYNEDVIRSAEPFEGLGELLSW